MISIKIIIDNESIILPAGTTILAGAKIAKKYIPTLCSHPELPPACFANSISVINQSGFKVENFFSNKNADQCGLCIVEVEFKKKRELVLSCVTEIKSGMIITTDNKKIKKERQHKLFPILSDHKHSCLVCSEKDGCSRSQCSSNVAELERCCKIFSKCEFKNIVNYLGIPNYIPKWVPTNIPVIDDNPFINIDYNLCIKCTRCVRVCKEIRGVGIINFVWNKKKEMNIGIIEKSLIRSECKLCTSCVEVCPTGCLQNKLTGQANNVGEKASSCEYGCPMNISVPNFLRMVAIKRFDEAIRVLDEKVPFPEILGRICMHPCEDVCHRDRLNASISICSIKKFVSSVGKRRFPRGNDISSIKTGKEIYIVGAGPAGLSAAYFLRKKGHAVTLYDSQKEPGGMLRYAIPRFRLPLDILEKEINKVLELGIEFKGEKRLGENVTVDDIIKKNPDAMLLSVGAQSDKKIEINGANSDDLVGAISFLKSIIKKKNIDIGKNIAVIGGGNVAVDVAMTAVRVGARKVSIICLERENEMPANRWEIKRARREGVVIYNAWAPNEIIKKNGVISKMSLIRCKSVFNSNKVFDPEYDHKAKIMINVDQVILAIGQEFDINSIKNSGIRIKNGFVGVNKDSCETNFVSVYAAGDATSISGSVVKAMASGKKAAENINFFLGLEKQDSCIYRQKVYASERINRSNYFVKLNRETEPEVLNKAKLNNFKEIVGTFTKKQTICEAKRCLQCDLKLSFLSNQTPPEKSLVLNESNIYKFIPNEIEGVYKLLNNNKKVISIVGTSTIQKDLLCAVKDERGEFFEYEVDKMYSKRESELIQKHLQKYGEMPGGSDVDDLF